MIIKIKEGLSDIESKKLEIITINCIGKIIENNGPLLNTTNGGDGGITWVGNHHNKNKKLEDIVGLDKSIKLRKKLSDCASKRIGELNPMFGKTGELSPNYGRVMSEETKEKIRSKTLIQFSNYTEEEIKSMVDRMHNAIKDTPIDIKKKWYEKISKSLKEKQNNGELFSEQHRKKLSNNSWRKINKGNNMLKVSEEVKIKISNTLKNRIFTQEHRDKLRKCVSFEDFETSIVGLIDNKLIKNISEYRRYATKNKELKLPTRPEKSYKNYGWSGWRKYGL